MIHIFNRKQLLITWNLQELSAIRDALTSNNIPYRVISRSNVRNSGLRTGVAGVRTDCMYQYYIYVKKGDYEKARYLIHR